jgi:hypothetical protein
MFLTKGDYREFVWLHWILIFLLTGFMYLLAESQHKIDNVILILFCFVTATILVKAFIFFDNRNFTTIYSDTILILKRRYKEHQKEIQKLPPVVQDVLNRQIQCVFDLMSDVMAKSNAVRKQRIDPVKEYDKIEKSITAYLDPCKDELKEMSVGFMAHDLIQIVNVNRSVLKREIFEVLTDKTLLVHVRRKKIVLKVIGYMERVISEVTVQY